MSINKHNSRVINNPDLLIAWEAALKENKKSNAAETFRFPDGRLKPSATLFTPSRSITNN
ncbi:MAG: hypothetical protein ACRENO_05730 [Thermodesulfobacteriota bacterium]